MVHRRRATRRPTVLVGLLLIAFACLLAVLRVIPQGGGVYAGGAGLAFVTWHGDLVVRSASIWPQVTTYSYSYPFVLESHVVPTGAAWQVHLPLWTVASLVALAGIVIAYCDLRRFARTIAGCCPRCGYDCGGNPDAACPECGATPAI